MTNAFNLVSLNAPTSALNSPIFGQIRTANPMRQVQMGGDYCDAAAVGRRAGRRRVQTVN